MNTPLPSMPEKKILVGETMSEAWALVYGLKIPVFILLALSFFIIVTIGVVLAFFGLLSFAAIISAAFSGNPFAVLFLLPLFILLYLIFSYFLWLIAATGVMLGIQQALGEPVSLGAAYAATMRVKGKLFVLFLFTLLLCVLVGIFTSMLDIVLPVVLAQTIGYIVLTYIQGAVFVFALPLVLTQNMDAGAAINSAFKKMSVHWLPVLVCMFIMVILLIVSMLPLLIGLIWTIPMDFAMFGILFREAYGIENKRLPKVTTSPPTP